MSYFKSWKMMLWKCRTQCQQIWKTQQWPQDWKRSVFIPIPKKHNAKGCSNYHTITLISHASRRSQWHLTPVLLCGKSHGRRSLSLVGYSPWGLEELDTTEQLHFHFSLSCFGKGNGNPLQCSCLENPRDGEPGGLPSMGSHRVGHDWSDAAAAADSNLGLLYFLGSLYFFRQPYW